MSFSKFVDAAIPLISISPDNKMEVNKTAIEILSAIPKPIAVVGVAGQYRTGKSYLLNRVILNQNSGFAVGPTINPCTKGIWIWGRPIKGFTKDGKNVSIIILDSEGLGAIDEDTGHDSRIFSLVMLLSSCFVYNSTGTIDESALENLSLIVDLTKNIQIKSSLKPDDVDYDDFAFYMPSFLWVVRDFALDLIDRHHNKITPDEYFDEALLEQEGTSDKIEQKNRIRRLLSGFFKDRHCFTLVRPLNDEEQLKNIEKLSLEALRPEFVEQMTELRLQILESARIKTLENTPLSGVMFANLLKSYVDAINEHKVPVIENCWNYICKSECSKALESAVKFYEEEMTGAFQQRWPVSKQTLKALNTEYFQKALKIFQTGNYGDIQKEYQNQLVMSLKQQYSDYKYENETQFETQFKKYMEGLFSERVGVNLKNRVYKNYFDLENDVKSLEKEIKESNKEGPDKHLYLSEFVYKKLNEAVKVFLGAYREEFETQFAKLREAKKSTEAELEALRTQAEKDRKKFDGKIGEMQEESDNATRKIEMIEASIAKLKTEKEETEDYCETKIKETTEHFNSMLRTLTKEKDDLVDERNKTKRESIEVQSRVESEIALLKNQIKILEERKQALSASEKVREEEIDKLKTDFQTKIGDLLAKAELQLKEKNAKIEAINEELFDLGERFQNLEKNSSLKEAELAQADAASKKQIAELQKKLDLANEKIKTLEKSSSLKSSGTVPLEKHTEALTKCTEFENLVKQKDVALKLSKQQLEKEIALNKQSAENMKSKYDECKRKLDEVTALYEDHLVMYETDANDKHEDLNKQILQLKENHANEVRNYENEIGLLRRKLDEEVQRIRDDKALVEQEKMEYEQQAKSEIMKLRQNLEKAEKGLRNTSQEIAGLRAEHEEETAKLEEKHSRSTQELEETIETLKRTTKAEVREILKQKEEDLKTMQGSFAEEKEKLETKTNEEKEKFAAKMASLVKNYEAKLADQKKELEEAIEAKEADLQGQYEYFSSNEQSLKAESANKAQKINEQTEQIRVLEEKYETYKKFADERIRQMQVELQGEGEGITRERDALKKQCFELENRIWGIENELKSAVFDFAKLKESSSAELKRLESELALARSELESYKAKFEGVTQTSVQQKTDLEKQLAIVQQQNMFKAELIEDLKKKVDHEKVKNDERFKSQKELFEKEKTAQEAKHAEMSKILEQKVNEKRKTQRELETKLENKIAECEKIKLTLEDRLNQSQLDFSSKESLLRDKNAKLKEKVKKWKEAGETTSKNCEAQLKVSADKIRELEEKIIDLEGVLDKEQQIYTENKKFYEEKLEKLKNDVDLSQKRFEMVFSKFNKRNNPENQENQSSQQNIITNLQETHKVHINELNERHKLEIKDLAEKCAKLEKELKTYKDAYFTEAKPKLDNYNFMEMQLSELRESEKSLQNQSVAMKQEREAKIKALEAKFNQDCERYRTKINELEKSLHQREKSIEKCKFSNQNDKAKLLSQMDNFKIMIKGLKEQLKESEEKSEKLQEEIEKVKGENKKFKMLASGQNQNSRWKPSSYGGGKFGEQSINCDSNPDFKTQQTKDLSKNFVPEEMNFSDNDLSVNKILNN